MKFSPILLLFCVWYSFDLIYSNLTLLYVGGEQPWRQRPAPTAGGRILRDGDLTHEVTPGPRVLAHPRHVGGQPRTWGHGHHVQDGRDGPGLDQVTSKVSGQVSCKSMF